MSALGQSAAALDDLAAADAALGGDPFLIYWYAFLMYDNDQLDAAARQIHRNTTGEVADPFDFELLGYIELERGRYDAARQATDAALLLDAEMASLWLLDALLMLREQADVQQAINRFDSAMEMGLPLDSVGEFARALVEAGHLKHAIAVRKRYSG